MTGPGRFLSVDECAGVRRCGRDTIVRAIRRGDLPAFQEAPGCGYRIASADFEDYLARHTRRTDQVTQRRRYRQSA